MSPRHTAAALAAAALAAAALLGGGLPAYASPQPPTPAPTQTEPPPPPGTAPLHVEHPTPEIIAARARLARLQDTAARDAEAYDAAREALAAARIRVVQAEEAARVADQRVRAARAQLDALAAAAYRDGSSAIPALLVTSADPVTTLEMITTLHVVSGRQTDIYDTLRTAEEVAAAAHRDAVSAVAAAATAAADLATKERQARAEAGQVAALLAQLEHREGMAELLASEAPRSAAARDRLPQILADLAAGTRALTLAAREDPAGTLGPAGGGALPPNPHTAQAIVAALNQLGKVYVWGAAGPDTFDCSGLTQWVWKRVGVDLPHNAAAQYALLPHVPLDRLLPGDLLFFWDPDGKGGRYVGHVGIYLGDSTMVDAPHTGDFVRVDPIWASVAGAGRVG